MVLVIIPDRVIILRTLCEIDYLTPSSLQLVPVTSIEEFGDERGEIGIGRGISGK